MTVDFHRSAAARLRGEGHRYTAGRHALVDALDAAGAPLTIREILEACDRVPQSSAYRNLVVLERAGVVHRVVGTDEFSRYELAEELTDDHHHHLICSRCGSVVDFSVPPSLERRLERALDEVAAETGFEAEHHRFDLVGLCSPCRRRRRSR